MKCIERRHEQFGVALFVIPALLVPLLFAAVVQGLLTLFG